MLFLFFILIIVISFIISILIVTATTVCVTGAAAGRAPNGNVEASTTAESQRSSLARRPHQPLQHRTATAVDASNPHPPETPARRHQAADAPPGPPEPPAEAVAASQRYGRRHSSRTFRQSRRLSPPRQHITAKATRATVAVSGTCCTYRCPCQGRRQRPPTA
jgi:type IV secretory pathway VirB10-like protein